MIKLRLRCLLLSIVTTDGSTDLAKNLLLLGMDITKWARSYIQEEHCIPGPCRLIGSQNLFCALNSMIPWLIRPAGVQVPPARRGLVTDLRTVETDLVLAG